MLTLSPALPRICLEQVSLSARVGLQYLLRDISFKVFPGDRVALVGASGAGKTSLLRLLNRLDNPSEGTIYLDGQAIHQLPVFRLRQQVMLVPQEPKLLGMTVQAALAYPLVLQEISQSAIQRRLGYWLAQLQIPLDWLERDELRLSLGERQLVAIARALVTHPQVLLLDEPTSALDVGRTEVVLKALSQQSVTVVLVTHQLELARQFCNRVLHLDAGELIQDSETQAVDWHQLRATFQRETTTEWT